MVVDPKCSSGDVGVIQCPQIPTVAAITTTTTTTPATTAPQTTAPQTTARLTTAPQTMVEDNTKSSEPASTPSVRETASCTVNHGNNSSLQSQKQTRSSDNGKHEGIGLQKPLD